MPTSSCQELLVKEQLLQPVKKMIPQFREGESLVHKVMCPVWCNPRPTLPALFIPFPEAQPLWLVPLWLLYQHNIKCYWIN